LRKSRRRTREKRTNRQKRNVAVQMNDEGGGKSFGEGNTEEGGEIGKAKLPEKKARLRWAFDEEGIGTAPPKKNAKDV